MSADELQAKVMAFLDNALGGMDPMLAAALAGAAAAVLFLIVVIAQRGRLHDLREERARLTEVAARAKEILATAPDGLFLWDHILGGVTVSRRLAVLLELPGGTQARYDDIREKFEGENLKALERCVSALRGNGAPFNIVLGTGARTLEAVGARAETEDGRPVADIIWMRDITEIMGGAAAGPAAQEEQAAAPAPGVNTSGLDDRHLTALLDSMPIPIWLRDSGLRLAFINRAAQGIVEQDSAMAERAREAGDGVSERRLLDIEGRARLMDITEIPLGVHGAAGPRKGGTVGYAVDRTEREEAEGELKRQSQARDAVLDTLGNAIAIYTADKRLDFANPAFATLWGLDENWLREKPPFDEILEKQRELRKLPEVADFRTFKAEQAAQFNVVTTALSDLMHLPDGRTLKRTVAPHGDGGLVFAFDDVTEQLGLERSVKELGAVQRETLDNLHEGVAVYGSDGRLKLSNPVYGRLWNLEDGFLATEPHIAEVIERTRSLVPAPAEAWDDETWRQRRDLIVARLLSRATTSGQIRLANDTVVDYANVPLPDGAVLLSYMDVTDSARVEGALRQRAEAFEEADRLKSEFIANVSYEVRTPLNTIIGFADMLQQNMFGELNTRQSDYAKGILNTSRGLVSVLSDILDLASIEAGRLELDRDTFDIHAFLVASLNLIQERARSRDLKLEFDCPTDIGWMIADEKRLKQVLFNLLSNAVNFTGHHGTVRLEARREGGDVLFTVADTGVGIPHGDRDRIFRPFERGPNAAQETSAVDAADGTGTGLGLTIVKNFVELHGGSLDVKSMPGRGTTVTCRMPARHSGGDVAESPPGQGTAGPASALGGAGGALDAIRAALAEDDEDTPSGPGSP